MFISQFKQKIIFVFAIGLFFKSMFYKPIYSDDLNKQSLTNEPEFKKLIYFVVDGLRYDGSVQTKNSRNKYHNNFDFSYAKDHHSFLSIAGLPTATKCRIFSMITGKPSNHLDYLFTFLHFIQDGDSLIEQALQNEMSIYHYGDRMWEDIFRSLKGKSFNLCSYGKESLIYREQQCFDLFYTGENKSTKHVTEKDEWPFHGASFFHMISLDLFGHMTNNINHQKLKERQIVFNNWIRMIYNKMNEDTLIVITSDHGVTDQGEHGGGSVWELASACVFLAKKKFKLNSNLHKINKPFLYSNMYIEKYNLSSIDVIHQDDILNTICYMMGLSLPKNACGSVIAKFETGETVDRSVEIHERIEVENKLKGLSYKKFENLFRKFNLNKETLKFVYCDWKSKNLKDCLFKYNLTLAMLGLTILILLFVYKLKQTKIDLIDLPGFVLFFYDSISYWVFSFRDLYLLALCNLYAFDFLLFLCTVYYLKMNKDTHWEPARAMLEINKKLSWISYETILICFLLSYLYKIHRSKQSFQLKLSKIVEIVKMSLPFFTETNKNKFCLFPNTYSLLNIHFPPNQAILLLMTYLTVQELKINRKFVWILFSLSQLLPHFYQFDMIFIKINYQNAFRFTERLDYIYIAMGFYSYFLLPKLLIIFTSKELLENQLSLKDKGILFKLSLIKEKFLLFSTFLSVVSCLSALFMHGSLVWSRSFADRFNIVIFNSLFDYFLLSF